MTSHLRLVRRLNRWFERAGVSSGKARAHLTIDLADSLYAAAQIKRLVDEMLASDPSTRRGSDRALKQAGRIDALAFTELKHHIASLQRTWEPKLMERLAETAQGKSRRKTAA
jgi:hypothetical protein